MEENSSKEINLLQLILIFFNWLNKLGKGTLKFFGYFIKLTYRHYLITFVAVVASLSAGLYLSRPSSRIYKADAMAMFYGCEAQTVKEVCKQLENSVSSNNLYSLATKLSIPDSVAKNIEGFQSFYVIDYSKDSVADKIDFDNNHPLTDTLNVRMKDRLYFRILSKNINQIPTVQTAILNYFNNNPVLKEQYIDKKNELLQQINICNVETQRIDSLAKVSYFKDIDRQLKFENNKLLIGDQRKQLFYNDLLDLQKIKSRAGNKLVDFKQPVNMPSGFFVNPTPINSNLKYGIISILIGYFIALVLSVLIENRKNILNYLNQK